MELDVRGLGLQPTPVFKRYIQRRLRHALRSFDIDRATVRLIRDHGRGRRGAHRCQVAVSSHGRESVRVNETHGSIRVACARATSQIRRALVRLVQRARRLSRATRDATISSDLGAGKHHAPLGRVNQEGVVP
jgi:ribosome-associated translation inhibitor RaiA